MRIKLLYFFLAIGAGTAVAWLTRSTFAGSIAAFILAAILFGAASRTFPPRP